MPIYEERIDDPVVSFYPNEPEIPQRVIISIKNGVPELEQKPEGIEVVIINHDVLMVKDECSLYYWMSDDTQLASTEISEMLLELNQQ